MQILLSFAAWNFTHFQYNTRGMYPEFTPTRAITSTNTAHLGKWCTAAEMC